MCLYAAMAISLWLWANNIDLHPPKSIHFCSRWYGWYELPAGRLLAATLVSLSNLVTCLVSLAAYEVYVSSRQATAHSTFVKDNLEILQRGTEAPTNR